MLNDRNALENLAIKAKSLSDLGSDINDDIILCTVRYQTGTNNFTKEELLLAIDLYTQARKSKLDANDSIEYVISNMTLS